MIRTAFRSLAALIRRPYPSRAWTLVQWLFWIGYFGFAAIFLVLRYAVLPNIEAYRGDLEQALSASLGHPVAIARIEASWDGLRPRLALHGVEVRDATRRPALALDNVEAVLAWSSLYHGELRLHRLAVMAPTLLVHRDAGGHLFVAGLEVNTTSKGYDFSDWLLSQDQIVVRDAAITWLDELRQAPALTFAHLNFRLDNRGRSHRFGLTAEPPRDMAARFDLRGDFRGDDLDVLEAWKGRAYAELDYADLAVWRRWIDYPLELPQGRGGLRLWLGIADKSLTSLTADVALADVRLRLGSDLPFLDLEILRGRLFGGRLADGYGASAKGLTLATRDGLKLSAVDFSLRFVEAGGKPVRGEFSANDLNIEAMARLSAHLPVDAGVRERLAAYAPRGRLHDLKAAWNMAAGVAGRLATYSGSASFEDLGVAPSGSWPGFSGLSGRVEGDETGGRYELASRNVVLDVPAVFPQPRLALASLEAAGDWQASGDAVEVNIARAIFANGDARGQAQGRYRWRAGSRGEIDLTARLADADAAAVWHYMPFVVGAGVRDWLQQSIIAGRADEATLRLKGDLARFPFVDGSGIFQVKVHFRGATLRYAADWPAYGDVSGSLLFEGRRLELKDGKAKLFGMEIAGVRCDVAALDAAEPLMAIRGSVRGPTGDFLRFVEASPVGGYIDHYTADMAAQGDGRLDLRLAIPLKRAEQTRADGSFAFDNNRVEVMPGLPPLLQAAGKLEFNNDSVRMHDGRATFLGAPLRVEVKQGGGGVQVAADGSVDVATLRQRSELPLLEHLSGSTAWHADITMRKRVAETVLTSELKGIASSLPPPFNKSAADALPLRIVAQPGGDANHEQIAAALGKSVTATLLRRRSGERNPIERGVIAIGDAEPPLPDHGLLLVAKLDRLDLDFWRHLAMRAKSSEPSPVGEIRLKAREANAFGYRLDDLSLVAKASGDGWGAQLGSREINGSLSWRSQGAGRLVARLKQLAIVSGGAAATPQVVSEEMDELPGLDISAEQFQLRAKDLGRLEFVANNHGGQWEVDRLGIVNDDGKLTGSGGWKRGAAGSESRLQFKLETTTSADKLLTRLGYPDSVRRGTATLEGDVSWAGSPLAIDYASLSGKVKLKAEKGQFSKLEPGAGRLLGILSLQSLPRRITLDFRDIFSEGFAFDGIEGDADIVRGVIDTEDLAIDGPSAKILMTGKINLGAETEELRVRVLPALGESIAVGAMFAHPAAGAVAWLVQKIFKDPVGKAFSYEYAVSGPWADPKVDKIAAPAPKKSDVTD